MRDQLVRGFSRRLTGPSGVRLLQYYQSALLRRQILYAANHSPFYRQRFPEAGMDPRRIQTAADLQLLGFFTTPAELQSDPFQFLAVPKEKILYAMSSSGTTGAPKLVFFTRRDWQVATQIVSTGLGLMGCSAADVVQIMFCSGSTAWMTGNLIQSALERLGAFILPTGNSLDIQKQVETIQKFGSTILLGTPSYLHRLTEEACKIADLKSFKIRAIRLGAEPWSESFRDYLEEAWGAGVYDSYGMMELGAAGAGECKAQCGLHLSPYLIVEVIHPNTGQPVPDGQVGELVFTTLKREGSPLIRYRSGDLGRLLPEKICPCGQIPTARIDRILGRVDDMLFLGSGENVFPAQFETALLQVPGLSGFQVVIEKAGYQDRLRIRVELANGASVSMQQQTRQAVLDSLYRGIPFLQHEIHQSQTLTPLEIEFLHPGTLLAESPVKLRRLVDRREREISAL